MIRRLNSNRLLDDMTGYCSGWSLRRLKTSYIGPCFKVRRSSDDIELDIYFNGNTFDSAVLMAFIGEYSGLITTWYDQNGKGKNFTQTNKTYQPMIVDTGVLLDGIKFDGVVNRMVSTFSSSSNQKSCFALLKMLTVASVNAILGASNIGGYGIKSQTGTGKLIIIKDGFADLHFSSAGYGTDKVQLSNIISYTNVSNFYKNKTAFGTSSALSGSFTANLNTQIGNASYGSDRFNGIMYELILANYIVDISKKSKIEQSQFSQI